MFGTNVGFAVRDSNGPQNHIEYYDPTIASARKYAVTVVYAGAHNVPDCELIGANSFDQAYQLAQVIASHPDDILSITVTRVY